MPHPLWNMSLVSISNHIILVQNFTFYSLNHSKPEIGANYKLRFKINFTSNFTGKIPRVQ